jgi:hypothetical protein
MIDDGLNIVKVGEPIGVFFGKEYAGVDPANGDALWFVNGEGTGDQTTNVFSEANDVVIGNPNPDVIGGVTNDFLLQRLQPERLLQRNLRPAVIQYGR